MPMLLRKPVPPVCFPSCSKQPDCEVSFHVLPRPLARHTMALMPSSRNVAEIVTGAQGFCGPLLLCALVALTGPFQFVGSHWRHPRPARVFVLFQAGSGFLRFRVPKPHKFCPHQLICKDALSVLRLLSIHFQCMILSEFERLHSGVDDLTTSGRAPCLDGFHSELSGLSDWMQIVSG